MTATTDADAPANLDVERPMRDKYPQELSSSNERVTRTAAVAAIVAGATYLIWRIVGSLSVGTLWLGIPLLLGELWGFSQLLILSFQGWNVRQPESPDAVFGEDQEPIAIIVTAHGAALDDLEHTLLATDGLRGPHTVVVVDRLHRPALAKLAAAHGAEHCVAGEQASDGFWHAASESRRPFAAWLHAGHIPMPHFLERTCGAFEDASVAVVQSAFGMLNKDSLVHVRHGRDEEAFERSVVGPAMSRRGLASWLGSGSVVRVMALRTVGGLDVGDSAAVQRTVSRLHRADWTSVFESEPLVFRRAPDTLGEYLAEHRQRAIEQLDILRSIDGPLRARGLSLRGRAAQLAIRSPFASGAQSVITTAVLIGALVSGVFPVAATVPTWLLAWAPFGILGSYARHKLGRRTMAYGDWIRHGWRTIGADASAFAAVFGRSKVGREHGAELPALGHLRLLTVAMVALDVALVARASTILWHDLLPEFTTAQRVAVLGASLVVVVPMVDVLQVIARRKQRRANFRIDLDLVATIEDDLVTTIDLAVQGVALRHVRELETGQRVRVKVLLPHGDGPQITIATDGLVRSCSPLDNGCWRVGIEFVDVPAKASAALFRFCAIEYPMSTGEDHAGIEARSPGELDVHPSAHHGLARVATFMAASLGALTMLLGPAAPSAFAASPIIEGSVCLSDSTNAPLAGGDVSYYSGGWSVFGTTDETGCVLGLLPDARATFAMLYGGTRNTISQDPSVDPSVIFSTVAIDVSFLDSSGTPHADVPISYYANGWKSFGTTDETGNATLELLAQQTTFAITYGGTRNQISHDTRTSTTIEFATIPVEIAFTSSTGTPHADVPISYYANGWKSFGTTDETGNATLELLAQQTTFAITYGGTRNQISHDTRTSTTIEFATGAVTGDPSEVLSYYANGWRNFVPGMELLDQIVPYRLADGSMPSFAAVAGQSLEVPSGVISPPATPPPTTTTTTAPATIAPTTTTSTTAPTTAPTTTTAPSTTTSTTAPAPTTAPTNTTSTTAPVPTTAPMTAPTTAPTSDAVEGEEVASAGQRLDTTNTAAPIATSSTTAATATSSTTTTAAPAMPSTTAPASDASEAAEVASTEPHLDTNTEDPAEASAAASAPAQPGNLAESSGSGGRTAFIAVLIALLGGGAILCFRQQSETSTKNAS